jgi:4,5-DOPA dioxygenase extradiol
MTLQEFINQKGDDQPTPRFPALFVGHGSPMNGIEDNVFARGWADLGRALPHPRAILVISAHWLTKGTFVHVAERPKTIHDFFGFPQELYDMTYDCPGASSVAQAITNEIKMPPITPDTEWGIDHGTWIVLARMFPKADIPVFQISIDFSQGATFHYELGKKLRYLRERGILIMASGNIVHNLGNISFEANAKPFDWAIEFDEKSKDLIEKGDHQSLIAYKKLGEAAAIAIPTPDHYFPLLYTLGLQEKTDTLSFPIEGITNGSIAMRAVLFS